MRNLNQNEVDAIGAANAPSLSNPFATLADAGGGPSGSQYYSEASTLDLTKSIHTLDANVIIPHGTIDGQIVYIIAFDSGGTGYTLSAETAGGINFNGQDRTSLQLPAGGYTLVWYTCYNGPMWSIVSMTATPIPV